MSIPEVRSRSALLYFLEQEFAHNSPAGSNTYIQFNDNGNFGGEANLTWDGSTLAVGGSLTIAGNTTLGDASGDSVTINAQTIDLANVAAGTDNTVLVYNGSSIVTDEIDSKVWAGNLIDYTGTPVNNQLAIWTDTDTVEGDSNLTWDGSSLTATGRLNASTAVQTPLLEYTDGTDALNIVSDGTISFAYGNVGSPSVQTTGLESDGDGEWTKILTHGSLSGYQTANVVALVTLNPMAYSGGGGVGMHWEFLVTARWGRNGANGTVYTDFTDVTAEAINSDALDGWDPTTDIILTYNSITSAEVWIKGLSNYTSCEVSILGGTSMKPAAANDSTSWQVAPYGASTWATFSSLGTDVYGTWVSKTLDELTVDGNTTLGDASGDSVTINAQTIDLANVAAGTDNTVLIYNGSTVLTDEIDSRVWGSTLLDGTNGTDNELAIFTDSNSVEGDSNLTWDGSTLDVGGALTVDGNTTLGDAYTDTVTIQAATTTLTPTGNNLPQLKLESKNGTVDNAGEIRFERYDDAVIQAGESLGEILFDATETDNGTYYSAATITGEVGTGTWTDASSHPGAIRFWTCADSGTTLTERMSIESDGTVALNGDLTVATAGSTIAQEAWTAVSYGAGWADYSVIYLGVSYMKDSLGFIHIRGMAKKTSGTADLVFTLPAGYRPANRLIFSVQYYDASVTYVHGRADVQTNSKVTIEYPSTPAVGDWVSFGAINFDTQAEP